MASVLLILENLGEDKHVESVWLPRLDEGSTPCLSAINAENQQIAKQTPNFTPKNVKLGVFVLFKMKRIFAKKVIG